MAVLFVENASGSMQDLCRLLKYSEFIFRILAGTTEHRCKEDDTPHRHRARARETQHNAARIAAITAQTQALAHMPRNRIPLRGGLRMPKNPMPEHPVLLLQGLPLHRREEALPLPALPPQEAPTAPAARLSGPHPRTIRQRRALRALRIRAAPQASSRPVRHRVRAAQGLTTAT